VRISLVQAGSRTAKDHRWHTCIVRDRICGTPFPVLRSVLQPLQSVQRALVGLRQVAFVSTEHDKKVAHRFALP